MCQFVWGIRQSGDRSLRELMSRYLITLNLLRQNPAMGGQARGKKYFRFFRGDFDYDVIFRAVFRFGGAPPGDIHCI